MTYRKDDKFIAVQQVDGFGKNPSLWVGTDKGVFKMASFGNDLKAEMFIEWLDYFLGTDDKPIQQKVQ